MRCLLEFLAGLCHRLDMPTLFARIRAARVGLGLSQSNLATAAGLHVNTVQSLELGKDATIATLVACQVALEARGLEFLEIDSRLGLILPETLAYARGARLRAVREALDLSRERVSLLAGFGPRSVHNIENGDPAVRPAKLNALEAAFEVLGVDLFDIDGRLALMLPTRTGFERRLAAWQSGMLAKAK